MVNGMQEFRNYFAEYSDSFAILGGAACDEWFSQASFLFRTTKDIDVVLILEAKNKEFFERLWSFLKAGGYQIWQRADGKKAFFRFLSPENRNFPQMIEILARPEFAVAVPEGQEIVPIYVDDEISSLSAILLDEAYYQLILQYREISASGSPLVIPPALILLKAKAYLNLAEMKNAGKFVKGDDLRKHRNDIFRLSYLLPPNEVFQTAEAVKNDLRVFLEIFSPASEEWQAIQNALHQSALPEFSADFLLERIRRYFGV